VADHRQQRAPGASRPEPVPHRAAGKPGGRHLMARDDAKLFRQDPVEGIRNGPRGSGHGDIMRLRSDKTLSRTGRALHKLPVLAEQAPLCPPRRNDMNATFLS
jgi:hypothetical protein